jgi:hypothetical protein
VASLDAITEEEFADAFRRWPVSLTSIEAEGLGSAIYAAIGPGVIVCSERGGYQAVRFMLKAQMMTGRGEPVSRAAPIQAATVLIIEPMPCAFI